MKMKSYVSSFLCVLAAGLDTERKGGRRERKDDHIADFRCVLAAAIGK